MEKPKMNTLVLLRVTSRLTQKEVANAIGISPSSLSKYETGRYKVPDYLKDRFRSYYKEPNINFNVKYVKKRDVKESNNSIKEKESIEKIETSKKELPIKEDLELIEFKPRYADSSDDMDLMMGLILDFLEDTTDLLDQIEDQRVKFGKVFDLKDLLEGFNKDLQRIIDKQKDTIKVPIQ